MNETTPPNSAGQAPGSAAPAAPFGAGFFSWLRGLGMVRGTDRWFAGVAGGIAAKAGIDPIIVRGIFVVLAVLGGPGVLLYLAGWLLLPDFSGKIHLEEVFRGRGATAAVIAVVAVSVFVVVPTVFGVLSPWNWNVWDAWGWAGFPHWIVTTFQVLVWIAIFVGIGLLISRMALSHGRKVRAQQADPQPAPARDSAPASDPASAPTYGAATPPKSEETVNAKASEWSQNFSVKADEFGKKAADWSTNVTQQADAWSARYAEEHDAHKLGTAHTVLTLAFALLAAGTASFAAYGLQVHAGLIFIAGLVAAVSVLAISLIIAGVRGRNTGWVGFLAFCGVVAIVCTSFFPAGARLQPFGIVQVKSSDPDVVVIAGQSRIDLSDLDHSTVPEDLVLWQLAGSTRITLPERTPVRVETRVLAGNVGMADSVPKDRISGPLLSTTQSFSGTRNVAESTVTVYLAAGNIRVDDPAHQVSGTSQLEVAR